MIRTAALSQTLSTVLIWAPLALHAASAAPIRALYQFKGGQDGASSVAPVISDAAGNLYGTTEIGGASKRPRRAATATAIAARCSRSGNNSHRSGALTDERSYGVHLSARL